MRILYDLEWTYSRLRLNQAYSIIIIRTNNGYSLPNDFLLTSKRKRLKNV